MANFEIIRVEKLKTMAAVKRSGLHTFREIPTGNAIPEKMDKNQFLGAKTAEELYQRVVSRIGKVDKVDKQAVRCLEYFVSASAEKFEPGGSLSKAKEQAQFFNDALDWIRAKHGGNVVSVAVHKDEKTPHLVVYVVPVVQVAEKTRKRSVNQKGGGRRIVETTVPAHTELSSKSFYGELGAYKQLQDDFHAAVGQKHGLDRGISRVEGKRRKKTAQWYEEKEREIEAREKALEAQEANLEAREAKLEEERLLLKAKEDAVNADIEAFHGNRVAYNKEWMEKIRAAQSDTEKKKAYTELVTPVKPVSKIRR